MATKADFIAEIQSNGYEVLQQKDVGVEGGYKHWAVAAVKKEGSVGKRVWFKFYEDNGGACYWMDKDPFETTTTTTFRDEVDQYLLDKITDGTIKAGYVDDISNDQETAKVRVILDQSGLTELSFLINKDGSGNLQHTQVS